MSSSRLVKNISYSSVTNISEQGFWVLVDDAEYFVPFSDYPVFKNATITDIFKMEQTSPTQLYWKTLDADIELRALQNPEQFPLSSR